MRRFKHSAAFIFAIAVTIGLGGLALSSIKELVTVMALMRADQKMSIVLHEVLLNLDAIRTADQDAAHGHPVVNSRRLERATLALDGQLDFLERHSRLDHHDAPAARQVAETAAALLAVGASAESFARRDVLALSLESQIGALIRSHDVALAAEESRVAQIVDRTTLAIAIGGAVSVLMIILNSLMQQRQIRERSEARNALTRTNEELRARMEESRQRAKEIEILSEMGELLQVSSSVDEMRGIVTSFGRWLFPGHDGAVYAIHESRDLADAIALWGDAPVPAFPPADCWALRRGRPNGRSLNSTLGCTHGAFDGRGTMCIPMSAQGETTGVFCVAAPLGTEMDPQAGNLAKAVADQVALSLANLRLQESLRTRAIRDSLTNLFNRRYMEESLERELARAARNESSVGVLMIDVDRFKQYNDTFGHAGGDAYLQQFAQLMQSSFRVEDIVCRYGGEEFAVILPEVSDSDVLIRADQLRAAAGELEVRCDGQIIGRTTISIGLAVAPEDGDSGRRILASADRALYEAKRGGRDRVVMANPRRPVRVEKANLVVVAQS